MSSSFENSIKIERSCNLLSPDEAPEAKEAQEKIVFLRPKTFSDYPGQVQTKENLKVYIKAALKRKVAMDHVIIHGPPGLGKTTLAFIIANELGAPLHSTSGPAIDRPADLAGVLAGLEKGSVLFIDEIHRLSIQVEEILYSAMEYFSIDIVVGQGQTARTVNLPIEPFTLVGATTRLSSLSRPFLSRFGIQEKLAYYNDEALFQIIKRSSDLLGIKIDDDGCLSLARRSRGTPRIANRLLKRVHDFALIKNKTNVDCETVSYALGRLNIDEWGLDKVDRDILLTIAKQYGGGPVGMDPLAVTLGEERSTIEDVYEPFLVHTKLINRTARGRCLSNKGKEIVEKLDGS